MKIIDKTSLQDANGNINIIARVQGTLKYGLNWYPELEAQKAVITQLDRMLEKGFVLIRNFTLPNSEIVIPMILIGSSGIFVIFVTQVKGQFEAKGDQWNIVSSDGRSLPASRNLIDLISKLTRAFQKYLESQKINLQVPVEPILIASDPGAQIESIRPIVRVLRSDAVNQFAGSLLSARPLLRTDSIYSIAERIVTPHSPEELLLTASVDVGEKPASRAQAIFNASDPSKEFNPNDLGFSFEDGTAPDAAAPQARPEGGPARPRPRTKAAPAQKKTLGMTRQQLFLLIGMFVIECCVVVGFGIFFFFIQ
ncbi:MAG: NERD domain-containing protein [Anaerolineales bacterium]|jgi:hypothetical protein|nr:NERD domain-containing protein [Anaerolineales bacterium]